MRTLEFRINNFVMDRTEDAVQAVIGNDSEYRKEGDLIAALMNEIESFLPKEKKYLINRLEEHSNSQLGIMEQVMYKQGFIDGFKLKSILER